MFDAIVTDTPHTHKPHVSTPHTPHSPHTPHTTQPHTTHQLDDLDEHPVVGGVGHELEEGRSQGEVVPGVLPGKLTDHRDSCTLYPCIQHREPHCQQHNSSSLYCVRDSCSLWNYT